MSASRNVVILFALALIFATLAIGGCGTGDKGPITPASGGGSTGSAGGAGGDGSNSTGDTATDSSGGAAGNATGDTSQSKYACNGPAGGRCEEMYNFKVAANNCPSGSQLSACPTANVVGVCTRTGLQTGPGKTDGIAKTYTYSTTNSTGFDSFEQFLAFEQKSCMESGTWSTK